MEKIDGRNDTLVSIKNICLLTIAITHFSITAFAQYFEGEIKYCVKIKTISNGIIKFSREYQENIFIKNNKLLTIVYNFLRDNDTIKALHIDSVDYMINDKQRTIRKVVFPEDTFGISNQKIKQTKKKQKIQGYNCTKYQRIGSSRLTEFYYDYWVSNELLTKSKFRVAYFLDTTIVLRLNETHKMTNGDFFTTDRVATSIIPQKIDESVFDISKDYTTTEINMEREVKKYKKILEKQK
jgi:hypothetical protein